MRKLLFLISLILLTTTCSCSMAGEALAPANVTYQVFVSSFQDSDGDGMGDLQGIIDQLDYIAALGVDRLWLSPIHPSVSYHNTTCSTTRPSIPTSVHWRTSTALWPPAGSGASA